MQKFQAAHESVSVSLAMLHIWVTDKKSKGYQFTGSDLIYTNTQKLMQIFLINIHTTLYLNILRILFFKKYLA